MNTTFRKMYTSEEIKAIANDSVVEPKTGCRRMWTEEEIKAIAGGGGGGGGDNNLKAFLNRTITKITSNDFEEGQTVLGDNLFSKQNNLKSIIVSDSITQVGTDTFKECPNLTYIEFGEGVSGFYSNVHRINPGNNKNALTVKFKGLEPPYVATRPIVETNDLNVIYVPQASLQKYKDQTGFSSVADKIIGY